MNDAHEDTRRLFLGLPISPEIKKQLDVMIKELSESVSGVRWVPLENLHVTLRFLGSCDLKHAPSIVDAMAAACAHLPLELNVGGVGGFPSHGSARVIWVGTEDPTGRIQNLYASLESGLKECGFEPERRSYRPHITIGRAGKKPVRLVPEVLRGGGGIMILEVKEIILYESVLTKTGAEYSVIETVSPRGGL